MASPSQIPSTRSGPPPPSEPPPPALAPEGALQVRTPSTSIASFIARLQNDFAYAKQNGLCPVAAAAFAATDPVTPKTIFTPHPHELPGTQPPCPCRHQPRKEQQPQQQQQQKPQKQPHSNHQSEPLKRCKSTDIHPQQSDVNSLRKKLSKLHDTDKLQVCRDTFMGSYKRSKTVELEANVRKIFAAQYRPIRRPPHQNPDHPDALDRHQKAESLLGCEHYARNCKLKAKCCGLFVSCRLCHDEAMSEDHEMDRFATETILCMLCLTEQDVGPTCVNCDAKFAHWYCKDCRFFENTPGKKVYHCHRCNICRLGEGLDIDNFHCDKCDACVSLESKTRHNCLSKALHANCPVCTGYLFTSTQPVVYMRCGHAMHGKCFENYTSRRYQCPLCMLSLMDMKKYFEEIDEIVRREPMPLEYDHKRSRILCNDCGNKCIVKYHFVHHKCDNDDCRSYNTHVLEVFEVEPGAVPSDGNPQPSEQAIISSGNEPGMVDVLSGDCSVTASTNASVADTW